MATTLPTVILLVFVTLLRIGVTQSLSAEHSNNSDNICSLNFDFKHQINDVGKRLKEEFSKTIRELKSVIKQRTECPKGWERYRQSCYMLIMWSLTWSVAEESCRNLSAYLAEIDTRGENDFIQNMMKEISSEGKAWLGGTDAANNHTWIWKFFESPLRFEKWIAGEPNNEHEHCMEMFAYNGGWINIECSKTRFSVCEKDIWVLMTFTYIEKKIVM